MKTIQYSREIKKLVFSMYQQNWYVPDKIEKVGDKEKKNITKIRNEKRTSL